MLKIFIHNKLTYLIIKTKINCNKDFKSINFYSLLTCLTLPPF